MHRPYLISAPTLWSCWLHLQLFPTSASLLSLEHVRHVFTVPQDLPKDSSLTSFSSYSKSPPQGSLLWSPYLKSQPTPKFISPLFYLFFLFSTYHYWAWYFIYIIKSSPVKHNLHESGDFFSCLFTVILPILNIAPNTMSPTQFHPNVPLSP